MSRKTETDIRLYGFEELYQKLDAMPNKLNSVVDKALKECAKPVKEEAKRRARKSKSPTGTSGHGHMADHIEISDVEQKGTEKRVIVGFTKGDNSPFFYAKFIEWGASSGPWSSQYYGKKPFMRPAYKAKVMESLEIFKKIIGEGNNKIMDAHEIIYNVLSKLNYPVEFDTYTGTEKKYITYFEVLEKTDLTSEDVDEVIGHDFQVDVFSNEDPTEIKNEVIKSLKENGFYQITCQDFYEKDTGMYHKAITCYLPEYKTEN